MSRLNLQRLFYLVMAGLAILLTWLAFRGHDLNDLGGILLEAKWHWIIVSLLATLAGHLVRAIRWRRLLRGAGGQASTKHTFVALMIGYFVNLAVPRLGEASRAATLQRMTGIPFLTNAGTVVSERVADVLCLGLLVFFTAISASSELADFFSNRMLQPLQQLLSEKSLLLVAAGFLALGALVFFLLVKYKWQPQKAWLGTLRAQLLHLWEGIVSVRNMPGKGYFIAETILIWLSYASAPLLTLLALGFTPPNILEVGFVIFVVGSIARTLPVPAGAVGAYHFFVSQALLVYHFSEAEGLAVATLNHAVQTAFYLLFGLAALVYYFFSRRGRV